MNEIKLYMKFLYQYGYKGILIVIGVLSFLPFFMAGLMYIINVIAESTQEIGEMNFAMDRFIIGFMCFFGVGAIVKGFEVVMRIRADRKSFIIALGIMSVIGSVSIGIWQMILSPLVQITYKQLFDADATIFIKSASLTENISLSLCMIMVGILIGCIYNRLGVGKFVTFIISSIALLLISLWTLIYYNEELVLQVMDQLIKANKSMLYIGISIITFLTSWHLIKKASFGNYTPSEGLARKGKVSIGNIRIGKI